MKNSKWMRFLLIALSVAMVLSLFACGGNGGTTEETTVDNTEDTTVEDTTVEDTTVEDTTVEDTTVEDTTVEDTTVEDTTEEDTTAAEPVFENDWHVSVDAFLYDVDGDFAAIEGTITAAATNKTNGTTIANGSGTYPSIVANFVCLSNGWIAVNGADVTSWTAKVYAADGTLLNTVAHQLQDAEEGVVNHVTNNMGYGAGTVAHRIGLETTIIALGDYAGQTVTVVYEAVVGEFTVEMVKIDVEVPALPEEETTAPVEINVELGANALAGITNTTNVGSIALSADGSYVTVKPTANTNDIYFYAYSGNANVTGRYAIIKYRATGKVTHFNIYASTSRDGATDGNDLVTAYIVADGEWHVMLIDLAAVKTVEADENGDYTVKFLRIDPFRGIGNATGDEEVDIAYVGIHESVYNLDLVANSSSMLELSNQFTFSVDSADLGGTAFSGGWNAEGGLKNSVTVSRDNANIAITGGWIAVNDQAFTNMGVYYKIVDSEGNATRLTKAGMNIKAAEKGVIDHCATANPGATPMRIDTDKGGLVFPDLKAYSGQTVTIYVYAISDSMWEEQGVIAGRTVLVLTVTVERSFKVSVNGVDYEDVAEAFAAAKDGDTVKFGKDVTLDAVIDVNKAITVDLNGKTVTGSFNVGEGGALTIGGGTLVGEITTEDSGVAVVKDGTFVGFNPSAFVPFGYYAKANGTTYTVVPVYDGLDVVFAGESLFSQIDDRYGDEHGGYSVVLNSDGTVTVTRTDTSKEAYITLVVTKEGQPDVATGRYAVIKYRVANSDAPYNFPTFAATTQYMFTGGNDWIHSHNAYGDGEWHVMVIDLANASLVQMVDGAYHIRYIRIDLASKLASGQTLDLAYVGFCDDLSDVYAGDTALKAPEMSNPFVYSDDSANFGSTNYNISINKTLNGATLSTGGWIAIREWSYTDMVYFVEGSDGWVVIPGAVRNAEEGVLNAGQNAFAGKTVYTHRCGTGDIDLSAYAGQTVTVYVGFANIVDGQIEAVRLIYNITANVPQ